MPSLARAEAAERAELLTVESYRLMLDLPAAGERFRSECIIRFRAARPGASSFVDLRPAELTSAELNGRPLDPATLADGRLPLPELAAENELRVLAQMRYSGDGEGLHRHVDPADGQTYLYAMSFLDAAPRWFACFDQPDLKARYDIEVRCPAGWTVLGNSPAERLADGHWRLATSKPMATYFVTLVAGPYYSINAEHDGIPLGLHARASLAGHLDDESQDLLTITCASFDAFHELFGIRYPWTEYHQVFVPDFNAGAMENPGCVTLRDQFVFRSAATAGQRVNRATTIAHEMAHMWFGDLVTMRWWDDLWLNESFAEYLGNRVCAGMPGYPGELAWTQFGITRKDWGSVADQAPSSHPIAGNGSQNAAEALADFDGISYAKGATTLRQLATHLGEQVFLGGLREHFARHSYGNASLADLLAAWTAAGATDLADWARQWLLTSGLDTLTAELVDGGVTVRRLAPDEARRPHKIRLAGYDGAGNRVLDQPVRLLSDELTLPASTDLRLVVADGQDDTWAKIRFGDDWAAVAGLLPRLADNGTRVVVYNAIRDAVRDSDLAPDAALDILLPALAAEPIELVLAQLFQFATRQLAGVYAAPSRRPARRERICALALRLLEAAESGSDRQLTAVRAMLWSSDDRELLQAWRAGRGVPAGLVIDTELRWALITRLAALGALTVADIDAELAADPSTAGVLHAARAKATRPDPAAKQAAWRELTEPSTLSAYELYAIGEGFFEQSQDELTRPYVTRFFADMPGTARLRSGWALPQVISAAYPVLSAAPEVLELAEATLAGDLDPKVRRALTDGTDVIRRAVRSRQRFG
ncbi:MAG: aminopeptidase N [Jatrophihabitantaceae bacterium]